jgi:uncharacterized membrane protein YjjB (DUF3815 family)
VSGQLWSLIAFDAVWSGVAATGFAVLFNTPRRMLPVCFVIGAVSHALRAVLMSLGWVGIEAGTLIAGVVIGFSSLGVANAMRVPVITFALPAAIPLVPGAFAFKAMLGILRLVAGSGATDPQLAVAALVAAAKTALILAAIVLGAGSPRLVFQRKDTAELRPRSVRGEA